MQRIIAHARLHPEHYTRVTDHWIQVDDLDLWCIYDSEADVASLPNVWCYIGSCENDRQTQQLAKRLVENGTNLEYAQMPLVCEMLRLGAQTTSFLRYTEKVVYHILRY